MEGYQILATIHDYNNPSQKVSQKMITEMDRIYTISKKNVKTKIYDNGLTRGVKIKIFCKDLSEVQKHLQVLNMIIVERIRIYLPEKAIPSIRIVLTKRS